MKAMGNLASATKNKAISLIPKKKNNDSNLKKSPNTSRKIQDKPEIPLTTINQGSAKKDATSVGKNLDKINSTAIKSVPINITESSITSDFTKDSKSIRTSEIDKSNIPSDKKNTNLSLFEVNSFSSNLKLGDNLSKDRNYKTNNVRYRRGKLKNTNFFNASESSSIIETSPICSKNISDHSLLRRDDSASSSLSLFHTHLSEHLLDPLFYAPPVYTRNADNVVVGGDNDTTPIYGYALLIFTILILVLFIYALLFSKLMPTSDNLILNAIKKDQYYILLAPISGLTAIFFVFGNWMGMKYFRHN
ncbi:hypothetical protein AYI70_g3976 [Smittium culicis]|uniref:Uncharacterized protein n=1 Tax=Smittium culicis TaxID=133412 RepID=A0A1R1Y1S2_9FUNG|nr:hypothetical protein AYI70_g11616 [Smittium culicis]OMJ20656.1 hypothetical protein AYI70_g3976 [Smittium culicis]